MQDHDTHVNLKNHPNTSQTIVFFDYPSKKMVRKEERGKNIYKSDVPTFWYDKKGKYLEKSREMFSLYIYLFISIDNQIRKEIVIFYLFIYSLISFLLFFPTFYIGLEILQKKNMRKRKLKNKWKK